MTNWPTITALAVALSACALADEVLPCPTDPTTSPQTGDTSSSTDPDDLDDQELDGVASWGPSTVRFDLPGDASATGDEVAILFPAGTVDRLDVVSTQTRSADYNSSRSNRGIVVDVDDDDDLEVSWDGVRCTTVPCLSQGQAPEAATRLLVHPGSALDDGELVVSWAETTPREIEVSGYLTLGCTGCRHRGHVTVLKLHDTGDGGVALTSPLDEVVVQVRASGSDNPLYEQVLHGGTNPIATVAGSTGGSWPSGARVEETASGTLVSLLW